MNESARPKARNVLTDAGIGHWSEKYLGLQYREGEFDCLDFVALVMKEHFGRDLWLPRRDRSDGIHKRSGQIYAYWRNFAKKTEFPREGNAVLLRPVGSSMFGTHIGVVVIIQGSFYSLHLLEEMGAVMHSVKDEEIRRAGFEVEGFYSWI